MTSEVASFSEFPVAWTFWALNLGFVAVAVATGAFLVVKKKILFLAPLVIGFAFTHGFRWLRASFTHDYPIPKVAHVESYVDSEGRPIPLLSSTTNIDPIAWGAGLTVILLTLRTRKEPIHPPQPTPGLAPRRG